VIRSDRHELLLGEWACLGLIYPGRTHGFAVATRLKPTGDVGRVWSLSRPLTYRSLEQLSGRGYIHAVGEERGLAGGNRTILKATRVGRSQFRKWLDTPVPHLRDLRSELGDGDAAVALQQIEDAAIEAIKVLHGFSRREASMPVASWPAGRLEGWCLVIIATATALE